MRLLSEFDSLNGVRAALEPYRTHDWDSVHYFWEAVSDKVRWVEAANNYLPSSEEFAVVFDPNEWNMPARIEAGRFAGFEDAATALHCTKEEVVSLLSQHWISNADLYVLDMKGRLVGLRSHEDPASGTGMWIPADQTHA